MVLFGLIQFVTGQLGRWVPPSPPLLSPSGHKSAMMLENGAVLL